MIEYCGKCDTETGRGGIGEDSFTHNGVDALCEDCFDNAEAGATIESLARGITQSAAGDTHDLGDFTRYVTALDVAALIADFEDAYADAMVREPGDGDIEAEAHTVALVRTVRSAIAKALEDMADEVWDTDDGTSEPSARFYMDLVNARAATYKEGTK